MQTVLVVEGCGDAGACISSREYCLRISLHTKFGGRTMPSHHTRISSLAKFIPASGSLLNIFVGISGWDLQKTR